MKPSGLHLLLTYQCNYECDHCFVWGSPWQSGTMRLAQIHEILEQGRDLESVEWIYFEGGEPFLYYPIMVEGVRRAFDAGFRVGIVTNGYWATGTEDALVWLHPLTGLVQDLSVSSDLYHADALVSQQLVAAQEAADRLGIPVGSIAVAQPGERDETLDVLMFRGRAAEMLADAAPQHSWETFDECPYEDLREPGRVHIDPMGNVHVCQGISMGNLFRAPLADLCRRYDPDAHPIIGPLLAGGPAEMARRFAVPVETAYADACHLCYSTRAGLRKELPEILTPDQVYSGAKE